MAFVFSTNAQQSNEQIKKTALEFSKKNDFQNALMVLSAGLKNDPSSIILLKELALTYYLSGSFEEAANVVLPLLQREDADIQIFQIAGNIFNGLDDLKQAEKIYKKGLKKFPGSGQLYSEYGQLLWILEKTGDAIKAWEQGIMMDPSHSGNYYHAAKFYFAAADKARAIVYGEVFVNVESFSARTEEMKFLLFESYKRIFNPNDNKVHFIKKATEFENRFLGKIIGYKEEALKGIGVESLLKMRTEFINDWFADSENLFPFSLFDRMKYMQENNLFESYNQWLFGEISNANEYQKWLIDHADDMNEFMKFQRNNLFHPISGQYYF
jgi:tetratricopeptide (TPR) repeat protein